jgi:hypothetical protein
MSRTGYVYKLYCDGVDNFYIGSTWDMKNRKTAHKTSYNNPKFKDDNRKVYKYIRANGGLDNWKYEILVEKEFENKTALRIKEKECINLLKPALNMCSAYRTDEERRIQKQIHHKAESAKNFATKIKCACGKETSKKHKARHEKSKQHQKYITNNITNITYNITNLHIHN